MRKLAAALAIAAALAAGAGYTTAKAPANGVSKPANGVNYYPAKANGV